MHGFTDVLPIRVIYGDTDQMGVVYYANYLRYFEAARGHFIRARGRSYKEFEDLGFGLPVIEASCKYHASLRYDDLVDVAIRVGQVKRVTVRFDYELRRDGKLCAAGFTLHACVGREGKAVAMPPDMIGLLQARPGA
jgi:acyl-CoA thioester hydrolase